MTVITENLSDIAGVDDNASLYFSSPLREGDDDTSVITQREVRVRPVDGVVTVDLDPGPAKVRIGKRVYPFTVPESDSRLWPLVQAQVGVPPPTSTDKIVDAVAQYMQDNPGSGEGDMVKAVFDPTGVNDDAFDMGNMAEGSTSKILTATERTKLQGISAGAEVNVNADWNASSGDAQILNKPTITATPDQLTDLDTTVTGTQLNALKTKVDGIAAGAEVNVNADWNASSGDGQILNKPTIPAVVDQLTDLDTTVTGTELNAVKTKVDGVATGATANSTDAQLRDRSTHTGTQSADSLTDGTTNKAFLATERTKLSGIATGAEVNVNADWNASSGDAQILNKPSIGTGDVTLTGAQTITNKTVGDKLDVTAVSTPATPSSGTTRLYAGTVQGVDAMGYLNSIGVPIVLGRDVIFLAKNVTGATITKGCPVYIVSASSATPNIAKAQSDATLSKLPAAGITAHDIANNATGMVLMKGVLSNVNTGGMGDGSALYVSTTAGVYTNTRPTHPNPTQAIGYVEDANASTGTILVNCGPSLIALHDGVNGASWAVGDGTGTTKSFLVKNAAGTGTLSWNPSTGRTLTLPDAADTLTGRATTDTLTNKRITKRVATVTSSATPTFATDTADQSEMLTLAANITSATFSGTPTNAQTHGLVFKSASAQTIALGSSVVAGPAPLLAATVAGKYHEVLLKWNSTAAKWVVMASDAVGYS